jgi:ParB-like chromosome segregation protein Spo0J
LVDQHGAVIDGYHRLEIGEELEMAVPRMVREFSDDEERREVALALKLKRRHLSRLQMRELIAKEIVRTPEASDRAIARRLGVSPTTVGTVRRGATCPS